MSTRKPLDLLDKVHIHVLQQAAIGCVSINLSAVTNAVDRPSVIGNPQVKVLVGRRGRWWPAAGQKKPSSLGRRGHVQRCLSELAKSGVIWERRRPEPSPHQGEWYDKHFRIRISKDAAVAELRRLGLKVPVRDTGWSAYWSPSLGAHPDIKYVD